MKIIELHAENVKRLKAVQIRPTGPLVEIAGRNGQGKSSVLDCIWWALAGADNVQRAPIRKGEAEAVIRLDLGEIKVRRTFKRKGEGDEFTTSLIVENGDGARYGSPQKMLDALVDHLSFDPLAFTRMKARDQFDALRSFVPGVDFDAIDKANKDDFAARTLKNREVASLTARYQAIVIPVGAPAARVDAAALVAEMESAGEHNADIERRKARREQAEAEIATLKSAAASSFERAVELRRQADVAQAEGEAKGDEATTLRLKLSAAPPLPAPIDTAEIRTKIADAGRVNDLFDAKARAEDDRIKIAAEGKAAEAEAARLSAAMEARTAAKSKAIAAAKMPVQGLEFGDGEILLNDIPFDQASDAERLRTSIAIAMASNPKLRVIRVRDGSLLDDDAMKLLGEMAEANDMQVWVECVGDAGKVGIVMEDGMVRGAALAEAAE